MECCWITHIYLMLSESGFACRRKFIKARAARRGGAWGENSLAGRFALLFSDGPTTPTGSLGGRCALASFGVGRQRIKDSSLRVSKNLWQILTSSPIYWVKQIPVIFYRDSPDSFFKI